jgi:hypothetical protein
MLNYSKLSNDKRIASSKNKTKRKKGVEGGFPLITLKQLFKC